MQREPYSNNHAHTQVLAAPCAQQSFHRTFLEHWFLWWWLKQLFPTSDHVRALHPPCLSPGWFPSTPLTHSAAWKGLWSPSSEGMFLHSHLQTQMPKALHRTVLQMVFFIQRLSFKVCGIHSLSQIHSCWKLPAELIDSAKEQADTKGMDSFGPLKIRNSDFQRTKWSVSSSVPCGIPSFHPPFCWSSSPLWTGSIPTVNDIAVPSLSPQPQAVHTWHTWGQAGYAADRLISLALWFYGLNFLFGISGNILNSPGKEWGHRKVTFSEFTSFPLHSPLDEGVTS